MTTFTIPGLSATANRGAATEREAAKRVKEVKK